MLSPKFKLLWTARKKLKMQVRFLLIFREFQNTSSQIKHGECRHELRRVKAVPGATANINSASIEFDIEMPITLLKGFNVTHIFFPSCPKTSLPD